MKRANLLAAVCGRGATLTAFSSVLAVSAGSLVTHTATGADAQSPVRSLEEVIVTAQKREQSASDVPISLTALTAEQLDLRGVTSTIDLSTVTPGLNVSKFNGIKANFFLRGIGSRLANAGSESPVSMYIDGVYQPSVQAQVFSFSDIERIEVLKGPQGTLFGRNAVGGSINVITRNPTQNTEGEVEARYEAMAFGGQAAVGKGYVAGGITETISASLAGYYREQFDGMGKNLPTGNEVTTSREYEVHTKWLWQPNDTTDATLKLFMGKIIDTNNGVQPYPNARAPGGTIYNGRPFDANNTIDPYHWSDNIGGALTVAHDFDRFSLTSISTYSRSRAHRMADADATPVSLTQLDMYEQWDTATQELQIQSLPESRIAWIVGLYYYYNKAQFPITYFGSAYVGPGFSEVLSDGTQKTNSPAVFAQTTVPLSEQTNLTLGARYTRDELKYRGFLQRATPTYTPEMTDQTQEPTWRIALDHKLTPDLMAYVSYNRGYQSGAFNLSSGGFGLPATKPQQLDAYELGLKAEWLDQRLRTDMAVFYYEHRNKVVYISKGAGAAVAENAAEATVSGVDLSIEFSPAENLRFNLGGQYLAEAEYSSYPNAAVFRVPNPPPGFGSRLLTGDATGLGLEYTPTWTVDISASYTIPSEHGDYRFSISDYINGGFKWDVDGRLKEPKYSLLNASVRWDSREGRHSILLYGTNLLNKVYLTDVQETNIVDFTSYGMPRTVGIGYEFRQR